MRAMALRLDMGPSITYQVMGSRGHFCRSRAGAALTRAASSGLARARKRAPRNRRRPQPMMEVPRATRDASFHEMVAGGSGDRSSRGRGSPWIALASHRRSGRGHGDGRPDGRGDGRGDGHGERTAARDTAKARRQGVIETR